MAAYLLPFNDLKTNQAKLQIRRNFENAIQKQGGTLIGTATNNKNIFKLVKDGKEIWVELWAEFTGKYGFTIIQKEEMTQDVVANAEVFFQRHQGNGHAAVYGIYFDTGKSNIKPESSQAIAEIAKLLKSDLGLKIMSWGTRTMWAVWTATSSFPRAVLRQSFRHSAITVSLPHV